MFTPGSYNVDVPVGYYTQVLGLGVEPSEVIFTSSKGVYSEEILGRRLRFLFGFFGLRWARLTAGQSCLRFWSALLLSLMLCIGPPQDWDGNSM